MSSNRSSRRARMPLRALPPAGWRPNRSASRPRGSAGLNGRASSSSRGSSSSGLVFFPFIGRMMDDHPLFYKGMAPTLDGRIVLPQILQRDHMRPSLQPIYETLFYKHYATKPSQ